MGEFADYVVSFAPWIAYVAFTQGENSWRDGFIAGLVLSVVVVVYRTIRRDDRFLDVGTLGYCAVMAIISTADPTSPVKVYNLPLSMAAVGTLSAASIAIGSPFTYRIARVHAAPALLEDPTRHRRLFDAHRLATSWWAGSQFSAAGVSAGLIAGGLKPAAVAVQLIGTLTPVGVTKRCHDTASADMPAADDAPASPPQEPEAPPAAATG